MASSQERINASSFSNEDRGLSVPSERLTDKRKGFLLSLADDRFLSPDYLGKLNDTSENYAIDVCAALKTKPHQYIKVCDEQLENQQLHVTVKRQYELTPLGAQVVFDEFGIVTPQLGRAPS